jgi:hypothetical protein
MRMVAGRCNQSFFAFNHFRRPHNHPNLWIEDSNCSNGRILAIIVPMCSLSHRKPLSR